MSKTPAELKLAGNTAYHAGDYAGAAAFYLEAIRAAESASSPNTLPPAEIATLFANRAMASLKQGAAAVALESSDSGLALAPGHGKLRLRRAQALAALGRKTDALSDLSDMIRDTSVEQSLRALAQQELRTVLGGPELAAATAAAAPAAAAAAPAAAGPTVVRTRPNGTSAGGARMIGSASAGAMDILKAAASNGGRLSKEQEAAMRELMAANAAASATASAAETASSAKTATASVANEGDDDESTVVDANEEVSDDLPAGSPALFAAPAPPAVPSDVPLGHTGRPLAGAWAARAGVKWSDLISPTPSTTASSSASSAGADAEADTVELAIPALPADGAVGKPRAGTATVAATLLLVHKGCVLMCDAGAADAKDGSAAAAAKKDADRDWETAAVPISLLPSMAAPTAPTAHPRLFAGRQWYPPTVSVAADETFPAAAARALALCRRFPAASSAAAPAAAEAAFEESALCSVAVAATEDYPSLRVPHGFRITLTGCLKGADAPMALQCKGDASACKGSADVQECLAQRPLGSNFAWVPMPLLLGAPSNDSEDGSASSNEIALASRDFLTALSSLPLPSSYSPALGGYEGDSPAPAIARVSAPGSAAARALPHHAVQAVVVGTHPLRTRRSSITAAGEPATGADVISDEKLRWAPKALVVRQQRVLGANGELVAGEGQWALPASYVEKCESVAFSAQRMLRAAFGFVLNDFSCVAVSGGCAEKDEGESTKRGLLFSVAARVDVGMEKEVEEGDKEFPSVLSGGSVMWPTMDLNVDVNDIPVHKWVSESDVRRMKEREEVTAETADILLDVLSRSEERALWNGQTQLGYAPLISPDILIARGQKQLDEAQRTGDM